MKTKSTKSKQSKSKFKIIDKIVFDKNRPIVVVDPECGEDDLHYKGSFGILSVPDQYTQYNCVNIDCVESCRESFHDVISDYSGVIKTQFLFSHGDSYSGLIKFIDLIEKKLKLTSSQKLQFKPVRPKYCLVILSKWWNDKLRFNFLTILLRAGTRYNSNLKDPINIALFAEPYFAMTREAVELFLSGYTKLKKQYIRNFYGWVSFFNGEGAETGRYDREIGDYVYSKPKREKPSVYLTK